MQRSTKYVGLDVHQASTVVSVREDSGRVIARSVVPTDQSPLLEFFRGLRGMIHVAFEEGTQAQWLHDLLTPVVARVIVCDRRGERRQGSKGDLADADELSEQLRLGGLRAVYHGDTQGLRLKELTRAYRNIVEDSIRVMLRLKALFRARGIPTPGQGVYQPKQRATWQAKLLDAGARFRAEALWTELDVLRQLHPQAKKAMVAEARRHPGWPALTSMPFLGPVRVALLLATLQTPWRFRTKRNLWAYAGLAVVTRSSADWVIEAGRPVRQRRPPMTRGLNRNHNHVVKEVFKAAATAASARPGPLQQWYEGLVHNGMQEPLARVTLARKMAAIALRLWKKGERFDAVHLTSATR